MLEKTQGNYRLEKRQIGFLLVHGIGVQSPGDFLSQFLYGFRLLFGHDRIVEYVRKDPVDSKREMHTARIDLQDLTVFLYEVHWADLITDDLARHSFDPAQLFVLTWFPWFNKRAQLPGFESYSKKKIIWWTCSLFLIGVLFNIGYLGIRAFPHLFWTWDSLDSMIWRSDKASPKSRKTAVSRARGFTGKKSRMKKIRKDIETPMLDLMKLERYGWFDLFLDRRIGDVINYITSMAKMPQIREDIKLKTVAINALLKKERSPEKIAELEQKRLKEAEHRNEIVGLADQIMSRFSKAAWIAVEEDGCTDLQVVGHSLGSVVAYHAMDRAEKQKNKEKNTSPLMQNYSKARLTCFHTIGSPLEKFHFFWPGLVTPHSQRPVIEAQGPGKRSFFISADPDFRWENYYSKSDKVSGQLKHYKAWKTISNTKIPGLGGVFTAHVGYKGNLLFLKTLAASLGAKNPLKKISLLRRIRASVWSMSQATVFPLFVFGMCLLGAIVVLGFGALAATTMSLLFLGMRSLIHLLLPDFFPGWNFIKISFWVTLFFSFAFFPLIVIIMPLWGKRVARISIARYWSKLFNIESKLKNEKKS